MDGFTGCFCFERDSVCSSRGSLPSECILCTLVIRLLLALRSGILWEVICDLALLLVNATLVASSVVVETCWLFQTFYTLCHLFELSLSLPLLVHVHLSVFSEVHQDLNVNADK